MRRGEERRGEELRTIFFAREDKKVLKSASLTLPLPLPLMASSPSCAAVDVDKKKRRRHERKSLAAID